MKIIISLYHVSQYPPNQTVFCAKLRCFKFILTSTAFQGLSVEDKQTSIPKQSLFCLKQMYRQSGLTSNAVLWWKINMFVHAFKKYFTYLFIYMANFFPLDVLFCLVLIWKNRINIQWTHSSVWEQTKLKSFYLTSWSALYVLIFTCWLPSWH